MEAGQTWRLSLFGSLTVISPSGEVLHVSRPKVAELLAFLSLRRTPIVDRDSIVEALWPDADFNSGRNRLKQSLALLRHEIPNLPIIVHGKNGIELDRSKVQVETETFDARLKWLRALQPHERADAARQMWDVISRGLLPEMRASWVLGEQIRLANIEEKLRLDFETAPLSAKPGFRFGDELGGADIPIVGREEELEWIDRWLSRSPGRILCLVGPPGVGKTRLLKEALSPVRGNSDATISLSTVQASEAPWLERIGQVIGLRGNELVTEGLVRLLVGFKRPVIALDDLDQADADMQEWLNQFRHQVPDLKIIGTARRRSPDPAIEHFEVRPLSAASEGTPGARDLLVSFATHFGVSARSLHQNLDVLGDIATHLEGLPLSLEVAAGWLPYMRPDKLLEQLRASPSLVIDRSAHGHDSLRTCIQAICATLPEPDRFALRCLSVCRGGCGEELAEEMFGKDWPWKLRALSERSLLFKVEGNRGNRFVVLQAIRESVELVEPSKEMAEAIENHRSACLKLVDRAIWQINEGDRAVWLDWLRDEGDNVLAACARSLDNDVLLLEAVLRLQRLRTAFRIIRRPSEFLKLFQETCERISRQCPENGIGTPMALVRLRLEEMSANGHAKEAAELAAERTRLMIDAERTAFDIADAFDVEGDIRLLADDLLGAMDSFSRAADYFLLDHYRRHALWMEAKISGIERTLLGGNGGQERRQKALIRAMELDDFNSVGMYSKLFAKEAMASEQWTEAQSLALQSSTAFAKVGETANIFASLVVLAAAQLGSGDSAAARQSLDRASEFAPLEGDNSLPEYNVLRESIFAHLLQEA